jgi:glyoxylase-like metal-dependent hydrolase (beta-lactamase superfamily II)
VVDPTPHPWDELADGVFRRRYPSLDLNVGLVIGGGGALVVDTRASHGQARELCDEIGKVTSLPVRWVVNTHYHWDHVFGNAMFTGAALWGHVRCRDFLVAHGEESKLGALAWVGEANREAIEEVVIVPPTHIVDPSGAIDIGGRSVTLQWLGLGHTDSDIVVGVSDADVLFAGDLLENGAPPYFGDGFPLAWEDTANAIRMRAVGFTVPGHGDVMGPADVAAQAEELAAVAALCAEGIATGSFDQTTGPYPPETMAAAWARAKLEAGLGEPT